MALETYRRKRDFSKTAEPRGKRAPSDSDLFVIQKHAARRLHYDFRLAMDGVLKSWAVTRGPSFDPNEKRLAVHVEDHPMDYGDFEGTIPKGEYGGGNVIVWDRGHWTPIGDPHKGYAKGHLEFELDGEKLHGRWHLVRMRGRPREKRENWLLIKGDDEFAREPGAPDILEEKPDSVKTGRSVEALTGEPPGWSSKTGRITRPEEPAVKPAAKKAAAAVFKAPDLSKLKGAAKKALPDFVEPALASLSAKAPSGTRWLHELKYDGYRIEARLDKGKVKLLTRSGLDWTKKFAAPLLDAFQSLPVKSALLDGELVVENATGASDFSALQEALSENRGERFLYYAFDLLYLDGYDLRGVPLIKRKEILQALIKTQADPLRYSDHFAEDGELVRRHVCGLGLEGIVSKLRDAAYRSGRHKDWLKIKCGTRQEFVIGGFVSSTTARKAIGSLALGYYDKKGQLQHVGRVGTGFTQTVAADLYKQLEKMRMATSPFANKLTADQARQLVYVKPQLVADIDYRGWTADSHLRHAAFRGLRQDKPASEVVREEAENPVADKSVTPPAPKISVKLTHPDRLYWPEAGVTKAGLADYYTDVWARIAPFVVARPLSLLRCPGGITDACFFQKHAWKGLSKSIHLIPDPEDPTGEQILTIDDLDGLIGLVQGAVLEIHPWGSTLAALEQPDMIIMDLDPGEGVIWTDIIAAAKELRERFAQVGLASFVKTSGGKGLHVVAPLKPKANWDAVKTFAHDMAAQMAADDPNRYVATITKAKRGGKILIDYLRNGRGATAVAPYSTRARAGAPVSMPLAWDELSGEIGPNYFTLLNTPTRLSDLSRDPWADFFRAAKPLPSALKPVQAAAGGKSKAARGKSKAAGEKQKAETVKSAKSKPEKAKPDKTTRRTPKRTSPKRTPARRTASN